MSVIPSVINYLYSLNKKGRSVTVEMKVWGNCGKCKARIEKAVKLPIAMSTIGTELKGPGCL